MKRNFFLIYILLTITIIHIMQAQVVFRVGSDSSDSGKDLAIDKNGNTIVAGSFGGTVDFDPGIDVQELVSHGSTDNFIAKYSSTGTYIWSISFGSTGPDEPSALALDTNGNIYVCGYISGTTDFDPGVGIANRTSNGLKDAYLAKYDSNGNYLWANTFGAGGDDEAFDLKVDNYDNIYMVGYFKDSVNFDPVGAVSKLVSTGGEDIFVAKYNSNGDYLWAFNMGTVNDDEGLAIALDNSGNCFISGFMWSETIIPKTTPRIISSNVSTNIFLTKCSSVTGALMWTCIMGGQGFNHTSPGGIAIDSVGNVYLTGGFSGTVDFDPGFHVVNLTSHGSQDVFVAKYSTNGIYQSCFNIGGTDRAMGNKIAVDNKNNIYLCGWFNGTVDFDPSSGTYNVNSFGTGGASDIFIACYNFQNDLAWVDDIGPTVNGPNFTTSANSLRLDNLKNCIVTGQFFYTCNFNPKSTGINLTSAGSSDVFIAKYNSMGAISRNIPIFSASPKIIDFGDISVGANKELGFLVNNDGDGLLQISSVTVDNSTFTVSPTSCVVEPFSYKQFVVTFTPPELGLQSGNIVFTHNAGGGIDSVFVRGNGAGLQATVSMDISPGWNMLSMPVFVADSRTNILFPSVKSSAFAYVGSSYVIKDTLRTITGYWMKFDSAQTFTFTGLAKNIDTIYVRPGWNLIGSISFPASTSSIIQEPADIVKSKFFGYAGVYSEATSLIPGKGYWVKISQSGRLIVQSP